MRSILNGSPNGIAAYLRAHGYEIHTLFVTPGDGMTLRKQIENLEANSSISHAFIEKSLLTSEPLALQKENFLNNSTLFTFDRLTPLDQALDYAILLAESEFQCSY